MTDNQQPADTSNQSTPSQTQDDVINPWGTRRPFQLKKPVRPTIPPAPPATPDPAATTNDPAAVNNDGRDGVRQLNDILNSFSSVLHVQNLILGGTISGSILGGQANTIHTQSVRSAGSYIAPAATTRDENVSIDEIFNSAEKVEAWFFDHLQGKEVYQAFVLTVAIFAGNSDRFIHQATELLINKLFPETDENSVQIQAKNAPFSRSVGRMMKATFTGKGYIQINTESGKTELETIDFIDNRIRPAIIRLLCESPDMKSIHNQIVEWLTAWIEANDQTLRDTGTPLPGLTQIQSALMLGNFGKFDYTYYLNAIIRPWAKSNQFTHRFTVGWVLLGLMLDYDDTTEMSDEYDNQKRSISLVKHWATTNNANYQWTAAAALSRVGLIVPEVVFPLFKDLIASPYEDVQWAAWVSLRLLYESGAYYAKKIILELASWLGDAEKQDLSDKASLSFMRVMDRRFEQTATQSDPKTQTQTWTNPEETATASPQITVWQLIGDELVDEVESVTTAVVDLLSHALQHRDAKVANQVMEKMMDWLDTLEVSNQPKAQDAFVQVMGHINRNPQLKRYITYILSKPQYAGYALVHHIQTFS